MALIVTSRSGRRYDREDLEFGEILSGRVALALDNAGLFSELEALEAQQTAALGSLAEAVTMQNARGELVYANEAAARAFGFRSAQELLATPLEQLNDAYESYNEDGSPLRSEQLPSRQVLAGEPASPLTIRAIHRATGEERWRIIKTTAVADDGGVPRLAVNVIEDVTEVKRAELAQRFLARAGELLSSSLDYEETLAQVTRLAVPELADWCGVSLPDDHGYLRSVAVAHVDPTMVRFAQDYNQRYPTKTSDPAGAAQVVRDGESQVVNEITDALLEQAIADPEQLDAIRTLGMRAVMIVPIVAAGGVVGTINFVSAESGRTFTPADVALAEEIGRRAGTAIENARLYTERSYVAHTLQASLLPDELPRIPRFEVASLYRPAGEASFVGGDFYDAFETAAGWMLVVGDVTGRGVEAAALTAQARHTVRAVGALLADPAAAIDRLNRTLAAKPQLSICTVAIVLLTETEAAATATVVCAGHPRPLLVRDGAVRPVGSGGPMVGAWQDSVWESERFELEPNDLLVLYTDGVTDARAGAERFSDERLIAAVRDAADADDAVARVLAAVEAFERGPQADDTALVVARRLARPPRRASAASAARSRQRRGPARSPPR
jgi:PAS domain S-box-containing protein